MSSWLPLFLPRSRNLTYLPAQPLLAEAVPEVEEDCPCISRRLVIRNQSKSLRAV